MVSENTPGKTTPGETYIAIAIPCFLFALFGMLLYLVLKRYMYMYYMCDIIWFFSPSQFIKKYQSIISSELSCSFLMKCYYVVAYLGSYQMSAK